jgi:glycerate kinase
VGVPLVAFAGAVRPGFEALYSRGLSAVRPILRRTCTHAEALAEAETNLERAAEDVARLLAAISRAMRGR